MADKKIQLQDVQGNSLYPKTLAELVQTTDGGNLGTVEAGAQVNKLEGVSVNGAAVTITNKVAQITLPAASEYSLAKTTAAEGYAASYMLTKDGAQVGETINIPKDMVVQSGSVKEVTTANSPVSGYKVGDKYVDLVLANADDEHIYILVSDLIDVYTAGNGISVSGNTISIDTSVVALKTDVAAVEAEVAKKAAQTDLDALEAEVDKKANSADVYTKTQTDTLLAAKAAQTDLDAVEADVSALEATVATKADAATTLAGYGITDGITFVEIA